MASSRVFGHESDSAPRREYDPAFSYRQDYCINRVLMSGALRDNNSNRSQRSPLRRVRFKSTESERRVSIEVTAGPSSQGGQGGTSTGVLNGVPPSSSTSQNTGETQNLNGPANPPLDPTVNPPASSTAAPPAPSSGSKPNTSTERSGGSSASTRDFLDYYLDLYRKKPVNKPPVPPPPNPPHLSPPAPSPVQPPLPPPRQPAPQPVPPPKPPPTSNVPNTTTMTGISDQDRARLENMIQRTVAQLNRPLTPQEIKAITDVLRTFITNIRDGREVGDLQAALERALGFGQGLGPGPRQGQLSDWVRRSGPITGPPSNGPQQTTGLQHQEYNVPDAMKPYIDAVKALKPTQTRPPRPETVPLGTMHPHGPWDLQFPGLSQIVRTSNPQPERPVWRGPQRQVPVQPQSQPWTVTQSKQQQAPQVQPLANQARSNGRHVRFSGLPTVFGGGVGLGRNPRAPLSRWLDQTAARMQEQSMPPDRKTSIGFQAPLNGLDRWMPLSPAITDPGSTLNETGQQNQQPPLGSLQYARQGNQNRPEPLQFDDFGNVIGGRSLSSPERRVDGQRLPGSFRTPPPPPTPEPDTPATGESWWTASPEPQDNSGRTLDTGRPYDYLENLLNAGASTGGTQRVQDNPVVYRFPSLSSSSSSDLSSLRADQGGRAGGRPNRAGDRTPSSSSSSSSNGRIEDIEDEGSDRSSDTLEDGGSGSPPSSSSGSDPSEDGHDGSSSSRTSRTSSGSTSYHSEDGQDATNDGSRNRLSECFRLAWGWLMGRNTRPREIADETDPPRPPPEKKRKLDIFNTARVSIHVFA